MNAAPLASRIDDELLSITKTILASQGFQVESMGEPFDLIVAENSNFVVAVAAMNTIQNLILAEPVALDALSDRIQSVELGPKKWDTYLVLLTQEKSAEIDEVTRDLYAINHDTSRLRRIAHTGVDATPEAVRNALAPFIEPVTTTTLVTNTHPLESLLSTLISRGISEELAKRAVNAFLQGASLDDVL